MDRLDAFRSVVRRVGSLTDRRFSPEANEHPFEARNVHPALPQTVRSLFDDGHYAQATFEAMKFLDKEVQRHSRIEETGFPLMMKALDPKRPSIRLTSLGTETERNEQAGYRFMLAGAMQAIRNPRGHEYSVNDDIGECLDHLSFVSHALRRLDYAGYKAASTEGGTV